jgi:hypothetical protein
MKSARPLLLLCLMLGFATALRAASEIDLGNGLVYIRLTDEATEPGAARALLARHPQAIIDLRSLPTVAEGLADALHAAIADGKPEHAVRMILINATTAPALISAVSEPSLPHVITLGPKSPAVEPDIAVSTTDEKDRLAHEAIVKGAAPDTLIDMNHEKRRFDEARLVHNHTNGVTTPEDPESDAPEVTDSAPRADDTQPRPREKKAAPEPVVDFVLTRAVQLHRALIATHQL